ncbi:unnamed protein product [Miscanthus lutarioriparius]|uniref:Uncharacterized protein n=1 Tax=Miscanthus lutarioriparius TaxID=422564 RepID=A0A811MRY7_9POAL|nr:unnamed protein product [Miscanthus lutarioriparius]
MSGHRAQNPQRAGQNPRPGRGGPYHGASALSASHFRPSRPPPPNAAALGQFEAASHQYAPAPASNQYPYAPQFGPPGLPPFAQSQTPPIAELVNPTLQFIPPGPPGPHQEEPYDTRNYPLVDSQQPLPLQQSPSPPPRPSSPPTPAVPSSPPPLPSPMPLHPSSPGKRHLEAEHHPVPKRIRMVTLKVKYMSVLDFFDEYQVTEPYKFKVGSSFGDIPQADHTKTTHIGATVLDGYVEFFFKLHAENKSFGGNFDVSDMLVSVEDPLHTRYGEAGNRPAYVDDFISRVEDLSIESDVEEEAREIQLWVIRHHPLLIEPAKRRLLLEDFYKFYKALDRTAAEQLIKKINKFCHPRWHVFTATKDKFISAIYLKNHQRDYVADPDLHEENPHYYSFTGEDGCLAAFLRNFIVHGPKEALACEIELEELELIVAHYFGKLLPTFLEEMSSATDKHEMLKEILTVYAERRSVSRRASGLRMED